MPTIRTYWLATLAAVLTAAGVLLRQDGAALVGLSTLLWVGIEWQWFRLRAGRRAPLLEVRRRIDDNERERQALSADQPHQVELEAAPAPSLHGLRIWLEDYLPPGCDLQGSPRMAVDMAGETTLRWSYQLTPRIAGRMALPGLHLRISDAHGMFERHRFVPCLHELTVLPLQLRPQQPTTVVLKQRNCQLLTGQHRHRQPGVGGELLSIRSYQPGDPPRTIAWKASARTGRLMTCEYETEAPVRATILCDLSSYQFAGRPGPSPADRVVSAASAVARLLLSDGDPVSLVVVNEAQRGRVPHGQGDRQLTRMTHLLMARLAEQTAPLGMPWEELLAAAWTTLLHRFPELLDERVNPQQALFRLRHGWKKLRRWQLSLALAELQQLPLGSAARLMEDDMALRHACQQLLTQHPSGVTPMPVIGLHQRLRAHHSAIGTLCRCLAEGVARARDNELFVLAGTLPIDDGELARLEDALRMARAAYHRVVVLGSGGSIGDQPDWVSDPTARRIIAETTVHNARRSHERVRSRLAAIGVPVAEMNGPALTERLAAEVELLRFGRARRQP